MATRASLRPQSTNSRHRSARSPPRTRRHAPHSSSKSRRSAVQAGWRHPAVASRRRARSGETAVRLERRRAPPTRARSPRPQLSRRRACNAPAARQPRTPSLLAGTRIAGGRASLGEDGTASCLPWVVHTAACAGWC
eukprot:6045843-Prymnesium_polylepis.1